MFYTRQLSHDMSKIYCRIQSQKESLSRVWRDLLVTWPRWLLPMSAVKLYKIKCSFWHPSIRKVFLGDKQARRSSAGFNKSRCWPPVVLLCYYQRPFVGHFDGTQNINNKQIPTWICLSKVRKGEVNKVCLWCWWCYCYFRV